MTKKQRRIYYERQKAKLDIARKTLKALQLNDPVIGLLLQRRKEERIPKMILTSLRNALRSRMIALHVDPDKWSEYLGCTLEELKIHLESQFQLGMTWQNHNRYGWHLHHVRHCDTFDLSDVSQCKVCFHFSNLAPVWAEVHYFKHNPRHAVNEEKIKEAIEST